ncbi:hypothetical protein, partial [Serratia proteamaculans]|uniref:hypothetical protein n=1 Tax=Serratia proteamaculans TaxID=28151 RepID=UPI001A92A17B
CDAVTARRAVIKPVNRYGSFLFFIAHNAFSWASALNSLDGQVPRLLCAHDIATVLLEMPLDAHLFNKALCSALAA